MGRDDDDADAETPDWVGRWALDQHAALYEEQFFNCDQDDLRRYVESADFDARAGDDELDPNEIVAELHEAPDEAMSRWSEALVLRSDLSFDPYDPPASVFDDDLLIYELSSEHGLTPDDLFTILGRPYAPGFRFFTPDAATQRAVRRDYRARRLAALERPSGPVHGYGARLSSLRYAWLELRDDGSFEAAGLLDHGLLKGRWRDLGDERLELTPENRWVADKLMRVSYLGDIISIYARSSTSFESFHYRRAPPLPANTGDDAIAGERPPGALERVSAAQWWAYLRAAPRLPPPASGKSKRRARKRPKRRLVLRPEPSWLRTPIDYLALRDGPWAPSTVELDLCALELNSEEDIKRVLGALSWPREPWTSLARVHVPEGFLVEELAPFLAASVVFAGAGLVEHME